MAGKIGRPRAKTRRQRKKFNLAELEHKLSWTVDEFCALHGFSRPTFFNYLRDGVGPRITQPNGPGSLINITREDRAEWLRRLAERPLPPRGRPRKDAAQVAA